MSKDGHKRMASRRHHPYLLPRLALHQSTMRSQFQANGQANGQANVQPRYHRYARRKYQFTVTGLWPRWKPFPGTNVLQYPLCHPWYSRYSMPAFPPQKADPLWVEKECDLVTEPTYSPPPDADIPASLN